MRARQRHLNPSGFGAAFVLDARFGFNQADNTNVSQWTDRSPNAANATESTSAYQPKYRANIQGGAPAVQFDSASFSKDRLSGVLTITNNVVTAISCVRLGLGAGTPAWARVVVMTKNGANDYDAGSRASLIGRNSTNNQLCANRNGAIASVSISLNTWFHFTNTFDGTNVINRLNESTSATAASSGNFDVNQYRVGFHYDSSDQGNNDIGGWTGYIGHVSVYNEALSASVRKRVQFANALAFKVACS